MLGTALALALLAPLQDASPATDLDALLAGLSPAERHARRITPEVLVARKARPAVVYVETEEVRQVRTGLFWTQPGLVRGSGSGVVVFEQGFVVTNYHVVKGAQRIRVSFAPEVDETVYPATVVSAVPDQDLALLKIDAPPEKRFPTIELGRSDDLMIGERVIAIGNPHGQTHTVSAGIISGLHRDVEIPRDGLSFRGLIQTDASINQGNSGGPLLNINGELIGINNAMNLRAENIGFAIPVDQVRDVLTHDLLFPDRYMAWLGFHVAPEGPPIVTEVFPGGPAEEAGLRQGDRVVAIDDQPTEDQRTYRMARLAVRPQAPVRVGIERDGERRTISIDAWRAVDGYIYERTGMLVRTFDPVQGFLEVERVSDGGPADQIGLRPGDLIETMRPLSTGDRALDRRWRFMSPGQLDALLRRLPPETLVDVEIVRARGGLARRYTGTMALR